MERDEALTGGVSHRPIGDRWTGERFAAGMAVLLLLLWVERSARLSGNGLAPDPVVYWFRMKDVFGGQVPYVEGAFEHLPLMLVPMAAAWVLGGFTGPLAFGAVWAVLSLLAVAMTAAQLRGLESDLPGITGRWLLISLPLFPLVVFRNDVWAVLLAVVAVVGVVRGEKRRATAGMVGGALAKGWPVILVAALWRRGWRAAAVGGTAAVAAALGLVSLSPGFGEGRSFSGLHTESLGGALQGLGSLLGGGRPHLVGAAGAVYVEAPSAMAIPGLVLGLLLGAGAVRLLQPARPRELLVGVGAMICAVLLASPLQSTQFVFWLTPFAAASWRPGVRAATFLVGVSALLSLLDFDALVAGGDLWWFGNVLLRNAGILAVGIMLIREERRPPASEPT